jgi:hypothetical protein
MVFVMYAVTAFIYAADAANDPDDVIAKECKCLYQRLQYLESNMDKINKPWPAFLSKADS